MIFGGSQGALKINQAVTSYLGTFTATDYPDPLTHQVIAIIKASRKHLEKRSKHQHPTLYQ